jgi:hypothetical protein
MKKEKFFVLFFQPLRQRHLFFAAKLFQITFNLSALCLYPKRVKVALKVALMLRFAAI